MRQEVFTQLRELIYQESGIVLPDEKKTLLENRITKRLNSLGLTDEAQYVRIIQTDKTGEELIRLIDAISTNVTHFYREERHFEIFSAQLREWRDQKKPEIKIWCAAASSGEEPYTLLFETLENVDLKHQKVSLLGTDICTTVLEKASRGVYREREVSRVPHPIRDRYMTRVQMNGESAWRVRDEIRRHIMFKKLNLVKYPYPLTRPIDIIFCRNVMIYFDRETRGKIVRESERLMRSKGLFFLSHSENLLGIEHGLKRFETSVFQKG